MIRVFFALFLSLMLALTSHSAAVAKGTPAAVDQMVICTGFGATVIYTDADGQRTAAPHICPDCVVQIEAGDLPAVDMPTFLLSTAARRAVRSHDAVACAKPTFSPPVRGPPFVF